MTELLENDVKLIFNNPMLHTFTDVPIVAVKRRIAQLMKQMPYRFALYGSSDSLDFNDDDEISDFDIMTDMPIMIFYYIEERLYNEFSLLVTGKQAMHGNTYRLRVYERTLLDITRITPTVMDTILKDGEQLVELVGHGVIIPRYFQLAEKCKMLLKPAASFANTPGVTDADREKWNKKSDALREHLGTITDFPSSQTKCNVVKSGSSFVIGNDAVYTGRIGRLLLELMLGIGNHRAEKISDTCIKIMPDDKHDRGLILYFNTNIIADDNITYKSSFNEVLPNAMLKTSSSYDIVIYNTDYLPPDMTYLRANIKGVIFTLPTPLLLMFEVCMFQLMPLDHCKFQGGCSYKHQLERLTIIMQKYIVQGRCDVLKARRFRSMYNIKNVKTVHSYDPEKIEQITKAFKIPMPIHPPARRERINFAPYADIARTVWSVN